MIGILQELHVRQPAVLDRDLDLDIAPLRVGLGPGIGAILVLPVVVDVLPCWLLDEPDPLEEPEEEPVDGSEEEPVEPCDGVNPTLARACASA